MAHLHTSYITFVTFTWLIFTGPGEAWPLRPPGSATAEILTWESMRNFSFDIYVYIYNIIVQYCIGYLFMPQNNFLYVKQIGSHVKNPGRNDWYARLWQKLLLFPQGVWLRKICWHDEGHEKAHISSVTQVTSANTCNLHQHITPNHFTI